MSKQLDGWVEEEGAFTVDSAWEEFYGHSGRASEAARRLVLGVIVLTWLLHAETIGVEFLQVLGYAAAAFVLDVAQYAYLAVAWRLLARNHEINSPSGATFDAPAFMPVPGEVMWGLKILCAVLAAIQIPGIW